MLGSPDEPWNYYTLSLFWANFDNQVNPNLPVQTHTVMNIVPLIGSSILGDIYIYFFFKQVMYPKSPKISQPSIIRVHGH